MNPLLQVKNFIFKGISWSNCLSALLYGFKAKENYYARCQDVERCRKDGTHAKDIEKVGLV